MTPDLGSSQGSVLELPLPQGFESIRSILDIENKRLDTQPVVSLIGLVRDYQPPTETRGSDLKCTFSIVDLSTQEGPGIRINVFYPRDKMPVITGAGDALLVRKVKVQMHRGQISLLASWQSEFTCFKATKLPLWPLKTLNALVEAITTKIRMPAFPEANYIVWLHHHMEKSSIPTIQGFEESIIQARNFREKYSLCQDLKVDCFYDLIGEAIRVYDIGGRMTVYLSDYTAHSLFYNQVWKGDVGEGPRTRDGDEYGYTKSRLKTPNDWPGPFGKMSLQITIYNHVDANMVREHVKPNDWVCLKNVRIKIGRSGCMEGAIRDDEKYPDKAHVVIITKPEDPELIDPRWKEAVRRKKLYWAKHKQQMKEMLEEAGESGGIKRKNDSGQNSKTNSKKRRKEKRAIAEHRVGADQEKVAQLLDLNDNIKCNHPDIPPTPIAEILDRKRNIMRLKDGQEYPSPFVNVKFRSNLRVVDFWPHKLEHFTVSRRQSEYDVLSDNSGGESTDNEEDMRKFRKGQGFGGEKIWEWRFALQVVEAGTTAASPSDRMWLVVNHQSAQMLLDVDEAVNLRAHTAALEDLRETLFKLWGDLEERKTKFLKTPEGKTLRWASTTADRNVESDSEAEAEEHTPVQKSFDQLPPDSDDENVQRQATMKNANSGRPTHSGRNPNSGLTVADIRKLSMDQASEQLSAAIWALPTTNKGFTCCIRQYGVAIPEDEPDRCDAGEGKRWQRMFGLFGTMIA